MPFEFVLETVDREFTATAVAGCQWISLSYSSTKAPCRAIVTDFGVMGIAGEVDVEQYVTTSEATFAMLIESRGNRYTVTGLRGCQWLKLEFAAPFARGSRSRLTHAGVRSMPAP